MHGIRPPGGVYCHVAGCDLVRDGEGNWRVLEDNVRTPSGISYVLENRTAMTRLVPQLFGQYRVRPVDHYPQLLLAALRAVAPAAEGEATIVVWTPGSMNSAYFEHSFLARQMGVELVEASDLVVRDDVLYMRTTSGLQRVHAVYRRLDDDFIDPLEMRPDSLLGVPGLMRAYRAGTVALANAVGTGVADDKAVYHYVPDMIRFYLAEEPILRNVPTYLLEDPDQLEHALSRMNELVFKPTGESGGKGVFIGPSTPQAELDGLAEIIRRFPERWIAQELVHLSTVPTAGDDGVLAPRHVDLRPFAVFGETIKIVPGGLTRVALTEGSMIVNSSRGGGSKDTWVLEAGAGDSGDAGEAADGRQSAARAARPALRGLDRAAATAAATARRRRHRPCSRGSPTSCSGSVATSRAPSTRRACSTASSRPTCRAAPRTPRVTLSWGSLMAIMGGHAEDNLFDRDHVLRTLTLDPREPRVGDRLHRPRARGRPHRARRDLRGDVGVDQHDQPHAAAAATSPSSCATAPTRSTSTCASARRSSGA